MNQNILTFSQQIPLKNLVGVVLKCPYANWKNPSTQSMFAKMVDLKLDGYQRKYFFGVMPLDGSDFIADHILICHKKDNGELEPLLGAKTLPYDICRPFQTDFSIEVFFKRNQKTEHINALHEIIDSCYKKNGRAGYYSSWTIAPQIIHDREFVQVLKEIFAAMTVWHHKDIGVTDLFGLGVPKYKTDEFFYSWGYRAVENQGGPLAPISLQVTGKLDGIFMHLSKFSDHALLMSEKYRDFWNARVSIGGSASFENTAPVAA